MFTSSAITTSISVRPSTTNSNQFARCQELISLLVCLSSSNFTRSFSGFTTMLQILTCLYRARRHEGRRNSRPACRYWRYNFPSYSIPDRSLLTSIVTINYKSNFGNRVRRRQSRPRRSWQTRRTQLRIGK
jgi:hypothetical protein